MALTLAGARMLAGSIWLVNLEWKLPPDFAGDDAHGLSRTLTTASTHAVEPFRTLAGDVLLPHLSATGWTVFAVELVAGVLLLIGWRTTLGAALGVAEALAVTAFTAQAPGEHLWSYVLLVAVNAVPLLAPASARLSVDAWLGRA
jgi:uncharacterized membrane protein YphA (DoxX/SURF4 family)